MNNQIPSNIFQLTITKAIWIIILYKFIIVSLISHSFRLLNSEQYSIFLQSMILIVEEFFSNIFMIWLILRKIKIRHEHNFKISYIGVFTFKLLGLLLIISLGYVLWYQSSIGGLVEKIPVGDFFKQAIASIENDFKNNPYPLLVSACIITPFFEEILFRGILLRGFLNRYKPITAIAFSAILFGIVHLNAPQLINTTLAGLLLGIVYYESQSLLLCIAIHALNNILSVFFSFVEFTPSIVYFFVGMLLFIIGVKLLFQYQKKNAMLWSFFKHPLFESLINRNISK